MRFEGGLKKCDFYLLTKINEKQKPEEKNKWYHPKEIEEDRVLKLKTQEGIRRLSDVWNETCDYHSDGSAWTYLSKVRQMPC
jgi:hypothetical protein